MGVVRVLLDPLRDRAEWTSVVQLGDFEEDTRGASFTIYAVVMDAEMAEYLSSTSLDTNDTYWSTPAGELPPGAEIVDQVDVRRNEDPNEEC